MMKIVNDIDFAARGGRKLKKVFREELLIIEKRLAFEGYNLIAGVDEAGRGPLAGPVIAAACILPERFDLPYLDDSKKLTPKRRDDLFERIKEQALAYAIAGAEPEEIDRVNILNASKIAMKRALEALTAIPDYVLVDGRDKLDISLIQEAVIDGDAKSASIAAGSILAKVTRDRMMEDLHMLYPQYAFDRHKGYGTKLHMEMLEKHGPCPIHRVSFAPVRNVAAKFSQELA